MSDGQSAVPQESEDAVGMSSPPPPASIRDLPDDQRHELIEYFRNIIHVEQTTGHMPPPSMLAAYEPDVQTIIVDEFAKHGQHRRTAETTILNASIQRDRLGMWLGFVLAFTLLLIGGAIILSGHKVEGLGLIAADAGALAVVYIVDQRNREN